MLKTKMIDLVTKFPRAMRDRFKPVRSQKLRIKVTRKNLFVSVPESQGGDFHVLPRPGVSEAIKFGVAPAGDRFALQMISAGAPVSLAEFSQQAEARAALTQINKALTSNHVAKWVGRGLALWLIWLVLTSYLQVSQPAHASAAGTNEPAAFTPPPSTGLQESPSVAAAAGQQAPAAPANLADEIYKQAMIAKARAEHENMPPKVNDNTTGLDGFGLETGSSQSGPGCDPKLAFKVPQQ